MVPEAHRKSNCLDGWYELLFGRLRVRKVRDARRESSAREIGAACTFTDQPLPYVYGYNMTNGTPLYRTLPSKKDRAEFEPWLSARARPKRGIETDNPYGDLDAGATPLNDLVSASTDEPDSLGNALVFARLGRAASRKSRWTI